MIAPVIERGGRLASVPGTLSQGTARSTTSQAAASSVVAAIAPGPMEAVGASAIATLYLMASLQSPL
jgi:hypothetical protein